MVWDEKPCCDKPSCHYEKGVQDCENCGAHCADCGYPRYREWKERGGNDGEDGH